MHVLVYISLSYIRFSKIHPTLLKGKKNYTSLYQKYQIIANDYNKLKPLSFFSFSKRLLKVKGKEVIV